MRNSIFALLLSFNLVWTAACSSQSKPTDQDTSLASDVAEPSDTPKVPEGEDIPTVDTAPSDTAPFDTNTPGLDDVSNADDAMGQPSDSTSGDTSNSDTFIEEDTHTEDSAVEDTQPECTPQCEGKFCGQPDGCGSTCQECPQPGLACIDGLCMGVDFSCQGKCGVGDPSLACQCDAACFENNNCCPDICVECLVENPAKCDCAAASEILNCGPNGCGQSNGECPNGQFCSDGECIPEDKCHGIGIQGCCNGNVLIACDDGDFWVENCSESNDGPTPGICGFEGNWLGGFYGGWYTCGYTGADPNGAYPMNCDDVCTPQCDGKECGDNGCGWTCGDCADGTTCNQGQCI